MTSGPTSHRRPPQLAEALLKVALRRGEWTDAILGDLDEEHACLAESWPPGAAIWYTASAYAITKGRSHEETKTTMGFVLFASSRLRERAACRRRFHPAG